IAHTMDDVRKIGATMPFPVIIRPAFTLGGTGGGIAYNMEDLEAIAGDGLSASPVSEVMIEQSVIGWKEFEMEVMRDTADNCVIVCSIENLDAMGVHTGDSITVAPAQTLSDREYQQMRDASLAIMREIGVETGGSNVQFGVNPENGDLVVIEMNPRVSRSSALASKATGFPIAKIAAKLAIGYTLDELRNDITRETSASFEPTIDYCVVKIPRFTFEKFPGAKDELTTAMKSVGETMAIGRTFKEALQKGLRSLETGDTGLGGHFREPLPVREDIIPRLRVPNSRRLFAVRQAMLAGFSQDELHDLTHIDPWFLDQIRELVDMEREISDFALANSMTPDNQEMVEVLRRAKEFGFSDRQLAGMWKKPEEDIRALRKATGTMPTYYLVDTCAAEFEAYTPYLYSTYETGQEVVPTDAKKVIILGGGPNRIGQGIEFDYCCCHASFALKDAGVQAIMVNSNPETVSTDYDTSDRLYFEPLTFEDVMHIAEQERPDGVIVQFGGQTPLNLAVPLLRAGVPILGTSPDAIDRAEDRERFQALLQKLSLLQPANGTATTLEAARGIAARIGYPVMVRPSYVLGGRAMMVVYDDEDLAEYFRLHVGAQRLEHPLLIDQFLENAIEVDVDALSDGEEVYVAGVMEHIEEAGIHSGDSSCVLPPYSLPPDTVEEIERQTVALARELRVVGLMNIQFAVKDGVVFILEVNPRASRTAPFVSKATGVPLPRLATQVMLGKTLRELDPWSMRRSGYVSVKESVFPFRRFPGVDILLGPEMRSTGEVMGIAPTFEEAFLKGQLGAGQKLPESGRVFLSVNDRDKRFVADVARQFIKLGFEILATSGTAGLLAGVGIPATRVLKVYEGRPNIVDLIKNGKVGLVINTASGKRTAHDSKAIRQATLHYGVPYSTTISGAKAIARAIGFSRSNPVIRVKCLQEYYGD
ncbi:MAG: carbamoyl-phosphate synthase large subunit, partial [Bilophila sp.]